MESKEELKAMGISNQDNIIKENKVNLIKCEVCGKEIAENAVSCPNCGAKNGDEEAPFSAVVISFLFPILGILLYIVNASRRPTYAGKCLGSAIIGAVVMSILGFIIYASIIG